MLYVYANFSNILEAEYKQRYWSVVLFEKLVSFLIKIGLTLATFSFVLVHVLGLLIEDFTSSRLSREAIAFLQSLIICFNMFKTGWHFGD